MTNLKARRKFLKETIIASAMTVAPIAVCNASEQLFKTPRQTRGPFYPVTIPLDSDNDLIRVGEGTSTAIGIVTELTGRILDERGQAVRRARVEIWQCDANGRYHHTLDQRQSRNSDVGFQGYGQFTTGDDGWYRFRTIKPVPYPGRTPHIHFSVSGPDFEAVSTQMYVHGEPRNQGDGLYNSIRDERIRDSVTVRLRQQSSDSEDLVGQFDIVLAVNA